MEHGGELSGLALKLRVGVSAAAAGWVVDSSCFACTAVVDTLCEALLGLPFVPVEVHGAQISNMLLKMCCLPGTTLSGIIRTVLTLISL